MIAKIGLCGGHRVGKTTLAQAMADAQQLYFAITDSSAVFKKQGIDPATPLDFMTRLTMQHAILDAACAVWQDSQHETFVTDRTPIDFMAYTLADIQGTTIVDEVALDKYIERCFAVTNLIFSHLIVVQPGIPLVYAIGKAALNRAYIEHLNTLVLGLCHDARLDCTVAVMPRQCTDLAARMRYLQDIIN